MQRAKLLDIFIILHCPGNTIPDCINGTVWKSVKTLAPIKYVVSNALERTEDSYTYVSHTKLSEDREFKWSKIVAVDKNGNFKFDIGKGKFGTVTGLSIRDNVMYVLSTCLTFVPKHKLRARYHTTVQKYTLSGEFQGFWRIEDDDMWPGDVAAGPNGKIAVSLLALNNLNQRSHKVVVYNEDGTVSNVITDVFHPFQWLPLRKAMQLYYDSSGYLHITDSGSLINKFQPGGVKIFDESGLQVRAYGASLILPGAMYIDSSDISYVIEHPATLHIFSSEGECLDRRALDVSQDMHISDIVVDTANCKVWTIISDTDDNDDPAQWLTIYN